MKRNTDTLLKLARQFKDNRVQLSRVRDTFLQMKKVEASVSTPDLKEIVLALKALVELSKKATGPVEFEIVRPYEDGPMTKVIRK